MFVYVLIQLNLVVARVFSGHVVLFFSFRTIAAKRRRHRSLIQIASFVS